MVGINIKGGDTYLVHIRCREDLERIENLIFRINNLGRDEAQLISSVDRNVDFGYYLLSMYGVSLVGKIPKIKYKFRKIETDATKEQLKELASNMGVLIIDLGEELPNED